MKQSRKYSLIAAGLCVLIVICYVVASLTQKVQDEVSVPALQNEKMLNFCLVAGEYNYTVEMELLATSVETWEIAHMIQYFTFGYLADYYWNVLNQDERKALFSDYFWYQGLPKGIVLGPGGPLDSLEGEPLTSGNPQADFENFLNESFREVDYQSAFSILQKEGEFERIQSEVRQDLVKRFPR